LLEGLDDRNAAANSCFDQHVHAGRRSGCGNFLAVAGDHSLVGGDDRFSGGDRSHDQGAGWLNSAHDLHHHVHIGVIHHRLGIGGEQGGVEFDRPRSVDVANGNLGDLQIGDQGVAALRRAEDGGDTGSHGPQSQKADSDPCRHLSCPSALSVQRLYSAAGVTPELSREAWACIMRRMLRKPLARDGVRLACRPVAAMKAGSTAITWAGVSPSSP